MRRSTLVLLLAMTATFGPGTQTKAGSVNCAYDAGRRQLDVTVDAPVDSFGLGANASKGL